MHKKRDAAATIKDVAEHAGVSPMTVSNVLRGKGRVSEETRRRVLEVAEREGYRPNLAARALVERKAPTLALMLGCITNPFYPEFTLATNLAALRHGRYLLVCNTDHEQDGGTRFLEEVGGSLADGVLVANHGDLPVEQLREVEVRGIPVVISIWELPDEPPGIPCVAFDSKAAGRIATAHLIELGHRRIGAVIGSPKTGIHRGRYRGYRDALRSAGIRPSAADERFASDSYESGYDTTIELLKARPDLTALFVSNDLPALGALNAAADFGLDVPRELSIVSITDIEPAQRSRPPLTTVAIPTAEIASKSVELLLALMSGHSGGKSVVETSTPFLVKRGSTAPVNKRAAYISGGGKNSIFSST